MVAAWPLQVLGRVQSSGLYNKFYPMVQPYADPAYDKGECCMPMPT